MLWNDRHKPNNNYHLLWNFAKLISFKFESTVRSRQPSAVEKQGTFKIEHFGLNLCSQLQLLGSCTLAVYIFLHISKKNGPQKMMNSMPYQKIYDRF